MAKTIKEYEFRIYGVGHNKADAWENALEQANQFIKPSIPIAYWRIEDIDSEE